jgi:hypothetical protein
MQGVTNLLHTPWQSLQVTKNGKPPMCPQRVPNGQWLAPSLEPEPPDLRDKSSEGQLAGLLKNEVAVTVGGLILCSPPFSAPIPLKGTHGHETAGWR